MFKHKAASQSEQPSRESDNIPKSENTPRPPKKLVWAIGILMFILGGIIGALAVRQYKNTKKVIVAVNGTVINQDTMFSRMDNQIGTSIIRQLVTEELQIKYAQARGAMISDKELDKAVDTAMEEPSFRHQLETAGLTRKDYRRQIQVNLAKACVITKGINVTEDEIHNYYLKNVDKKNKDARFYMPETITLQVIRNSSENAIQAADRDLRNGVSFEEAVNRYSADPSSENGGVLPSITRGRNSMTPIPGMENAVFGIAIGKNLGPVKFAGSWWIFHCLDKSPLFIVPYERAHLEAEMGAKMEKVTPERLRQVQKDFASFQRSSNVQVFWPKYQDVLILK